jgi:hypothetical protein
MPADPKANTAEIVQSLIHTLNQSVCSFLHLPICSFPPCLRTSLLFFSFRNDSYRQTSPEPPPMGRHATGQLRD